LGHGCADDPRMLYTAKCFWPGVTEDELRLAATRAGGERGEQREATFRGALYLPGDELVLCLFDSPSRTSVKDASERAGMPCERVIESVWIDLDARKGDQPCDR
jgi:Protein of unknown function (DUF4242)